MTRSLFALMITVAALAVAPFVLPTFAQSHPCDTTPPASAAIQSGAPYTLEFCSPVTDQIENAKLFVDGIAKPWAPVTQLTAANAKGLALYAIPAGQYAKGAYTLTLITANYEQNADGTRTRKESAPSLPFALSVVDLVQLPVPTPPIIVGLRK